MVKHTGEHADGRDGKDKGRGAPAPSPGVTPPSTSMVSDMELSKLHPFGVFMEASSCRRAVSSVQSPAPLLFLDVMEGGRPDCS